MLKLLTLPVLALSLASCSMMMKPAEYTLTRQPAGGALSSGGTVSVARTATTVTTTATVRGLAPNTYYVAHYHLQGSASTDPCASGGAPIMSSKAVAQSDASGTLRLTGSVARADVMNATYFNIHTATGPEGTPADAGVTCAAVTM